MDGMDLRRCDCLGPDGLPSLPDQNVDLILCDLPYGTTKSEWDSPLPLDELWKHYRRIIKPRGAIVLTASQPFTTTLIASNLEWFKYCWMWDKCNPTGHLNAKRQPLRVTEDVVVFYQGQCTYNPRMEEHGRPRHKGGPSKGSGRCYGDFGPKSVFNNLYYPTNIISISNADKTKRLHETQKPVDLMEYMVLTYTNEGELVLDNTMGSGTTGVAAVRCGRKFIGMELRHDYFETAKRRILGTEAAPPPDQGGTQQARFF